MMGRMFSMFFIIWLAWGSRLLICFILFSIFIFYFSLVDFFSSMFVLVFFIIIVFVGLIFSFL